MLWDGALMMYSLHWSERTFPAILTNVILGYLRYPGLAWQAELDGNEGLDFDSFLKVVQGQRETSTAVVDDTDTVEAFVALGGKVQ